MFKKSESKEGGGARPSFGGGEPSFEVRTRSVSVIGPTLKFKGELSANEDLIIEGQIEGRIAHQDKNLTVGKSGRVKADIHAKEIEIQGRVDGDIRGDDIVKLAKSAVVNGNIQCGRIVMEDGAHFSGSITMEARAPKQKALDTTDEDRPASEQKTGKISSVAG